MTFDDWMARYMASWDRQDRALFLPLFAPEAEYVYTPFDPVMRGLAAIAFYFDEGMRRQTAVAVAHEVLADLPAYGLARFHGSVGMVGSGATVRIDGVVQVYRDGDGRCTRLNEWWVTDRPWEGSLLPPQG